MGSSQSSRRVNDEAIVGDVARFLFLISTMNGRVESFMSVRSWISPANSGERVDVWTDGLCLRRQLGSQDRNGRRTRRQSRHPTPSSDPVSVSITKGGAIDYDHDDDEAEDPSILRSNLGQQGTSESLLNQAKEKLGKLLNQNNPANGERAAAALVPGRT